MGGLTCRRNNRSSHARNASSKSQCRQLRPDVLRPSARHLRVARHLEGSGIFRIVKRRAMGNCRLPRTARYKARTSSSASDHESNALRRRAFTKQISTVRRGAWPLLPSAYLPQCAACSMSSGVGCWQPSCRSRSSARDAVSASATASRSPANSNFRPGSPVRKRLASDATFWLLRWLYLPSHVDALELGHCAAAH